MSKISAEEITKIAALSHLELDGEETAEYVGQLEKIITYIDTLAEINVEGVEPLASPPVAGQMLRPDAAGAVLPRAAALYNAPETTDGIFFQVPAVVK